MTEIRIPEHLLPADGRFGAGPAKVPTAALSALADSGTSLMGTSHRQAPVRNLVGQVREQLRALFSVPDDYEIVMGNGGSTAFWDIASFCLVRERSQHLSFGEFSAKFVKAVAAAPHLGEPTVVAAEPGGLSTPYAESGVDAYAWPHNETSTAVMAPVSRVPDSGDALVLVDATSGAGGLPVDVREADAYYFAPQKCFASDGGLWIALLSPAALDRAAEIAGSGRWVPAFLDLGPAIENARKNQTYNTPSIATLFLMSRQLDWMLDEGGLTAMVDRTSRSADTLYGWAEQTDYTSPFVPEPEHRSRVIATIDFDEAVSADEVAATLRANGVVDTEPYRKLGRNQLRIATYPAVDPDDVAALTACIDHVVQAMA